MRNYKHLTFTDRLQIEAWQKVGIKPAKMAELLGVHVSTIYRELKRGVYTRLNSDLTEEERYSPDIAEEKYRANLKAKGTGLKIGSDHEYATYLEYKVSAEKYAPGAILGEIKRKGLQFNTTISKTTFYRYIEDGVFLTITNKDLPVKCKKDKQKYERVKPNRAPAGKSIEKRPAEVAERDSFGHWEMDCVVGKKGTKKTFLVLTERYSRYEIIRIMKDHTAASVIKALDGIERSYGVGLFSKVFQSITIDNGSEFSDYEGLERSCLKKDSRTTVYYCHPYSSYERGSNENQNKMVRRHYPKGISLDKVTPADTRKLEKWINDYPRGIFDYYSSADIYEACINSILAA
jgi:IS30 family transposase